MVVHCYSLHLSLVFGFGTGLVRLMKDNELLYIVQGVDHRGRKFAGLYNKEDADYLVKSDRLNTIVGTYQLS